jgi:hypothetical protein
MGMLVLTCKRYKNIAETRKLYPTKHLNFYRLIESAVRYGYIGILKLVEEYRPFSYHDLTKIQISAIRSGRKDVLNHYIHDSRVSDIEDKHETLFQVLDKSKIEFTLDMVLYLTERGFKINPSNHSVMKQNLSEQDWIAAFDRVVNQSNKSIKQTLLSTIAPTLYQAPQGNITINSNIGAVLREHVLLLEKDSPDDIAPVSGKIRRRSHNTDQISA